MWNWVTENFIATIIFGTILYLLVLGLKFLRDRLIKSRRIESNLSIHNNPSRIWRKGIYARDRFMRIYEAQEPLISNGSLMYSGGDGGAVWHSRYLDKYILERYGLVTIFEEDGAKKVKANKNRITKMVYKRIRKKEDHEKKIIKKYHKKRAKPFP